jgi:hypothetical protein
MLGRENIMFLACDRSPQKGVDGIDSQSTVDAVDRSIDRSLPPIR